MSVRITFLPAGRTTRKVSGPVNSVNTRVNLVRGVHQEGSGKERRDPASHHPDG